jgi:hypothetical protein
MCRREVRNLYARRVGLGARAHRREHLYIKFHAVHKQLDLSFNIINRVCRQIPISLFFSLTGPKARPGASGGRYK